VLIKDALAPELEFVSSSAPRNASDGNWHFNNVANGSRNTLTITARVKDTTPDGTIIRNRASINFSTTSGTELGGSQTNEVATRVGKLTAPNISLAILGDKAATSWNDTVNFTLYYNNTGDGTGLNAQISLVFPAGMTLVTSSSESNRVGNLWNFSSIPGGAHSFTVTVKIQPGVANNTVLTATASLTYMDARGKTMAPSGASASVTVTIEPVVPPPPGTRPTITDRTPAPNAVNVPLGTTIQVKFSGAMNHSTLQLGVTVFLSPNVQASISWSGDVMTITPSNKLAPGTTYTVTVTTDVKDTGGNQLDKTYSWDFTTKAKGTVVKPEGTNWVPLAIVAVVIGGLLAAIGLATRRKRDTAPPEGEKQPLDETQIESKPVRPEPPKEEPAPEQKPEPPKEEPKPEPKAEPKPEPPKEEPKLEPKPEPKPEPTKEQPKPEPKAEPKPEAPKDEPKPEPKAEPAPAKDGANPKFDSDLQELLKKLQS
jgi:uncharacterized repeat protein (TIGR01451 family)